MTLEIRALREDLSDFATIVAIDNAVDPEHRYTLEQFRYDYENFDQTKYILRYYLAEWKGNSVGYGCYHHMPGRFHPQRFWIWVAVHPDWQRNGVGSRLFERIEMDLCQLSAKWIHTSTRETWARSRNFLENRGFREVLRSWESHLDVRAFDPRPFQHYLERAERAGIVLTTLAAEKNKNHQWLEKIHELHNTLMADVPSSSPYTPVPLEHFRRSLIENPDLLSDAFFIAKDGEHFVGESFVFQIPAEPGHLSQGLTGVRREYRGQGIAMALKLQVIMWAKEHGYTLIKTWNAANNKPMLAINERLGFVRQPAWIEYEKVLV